MPLAPELADALNKPSDEELAAGAPSLDDLDDSDFTPPDDEVAEVEPKVAEEIPAVPAVEPPAAPETAAQRTLRERYAAKGLNFPGETDDEVIDFTVQRLAPFAQVGQEMYPHIESFRQWQQEQRQKAQAPAEPVKSPIDDLLPKLAEYSPDWEKGVIRDENGTLTGVHPWADPALGQKVLAYEASKIARANALINNIDQIIDARAEQIARRISSQETEQRFGVEHQNTFVRDVIAQNREWIYDKDAEGREVRNFDGTPKLSARGMQLTQHVKTLYESGVEDPGTQFRLAMQMLGPAQAAAPIVDPKVARTQQLAEQNRDRATRKNGRGGSIPQPGNTKPVEQNEFLTFRQRANAALEGFDASDFKTPI